MTTKRTTLNTAHLREQILLILDETGYSPEEVANMAGMSKNTIYTILGKGTKFTQRAIGRKIAEGLGLDFKIEGDKIFYGKPLQDSISNIEDPLRPDLQEIYNKLMQMPEERREKYLKILRILVYGEE